MPPLQLLLLWSLRHHAVCCSCNCCCLACSLVDCFLTRNAHFTSWWWPWLLPHLTTAAELCCTERHHGATAIAIAMVDCLLKINSLPAGYGHNCNNLPPLRCNTVAIEPVLPCLQCVATSWCCCHCIAVSMVDCFLICSTVGFNVSTCCHCALTLLPLILRDVPWSC